MEENYVTKIQQAKSALYGECNAGVSVLKKTGNWELCITGSTHRVYSIYYPYQDYRNLVTTSPITLKKSGSSTTQKGKRSTSSATLDNAKEFPMWN